MPPHKRKTDGAWIVPYRVERNGRIVRTQKYFGQGPDAEERAKAFDQTVNGEGAPFSSQGPPTLAALWLAYLQERKPHKSTAQSVSRYILDFGASFANKPAHRLNRTDLDLLRANLRQAGRADTTINKAQAYIRAVLQWAVDKGCYNLEVNPWGSFKRIRVPDSEPWAFSPEDFAALFKAAPPWLQWAMIIMYQFAVRPGHVELFGLKWSAVNWTRRTLLVRQAKSRKVKSVPVGQDFYPLFRSVFEWNRARGYQPICHRGDGQPVKDYRTAWHWTKKRAGLENSGVRMYDMRHYVASLYFAQGVDLITIARQMGHASPYVTATVYAHLLTDSQAQAVDALPPVSHLDSGTTVNSNLFTDNLKLALISDD